MSYFRFRMWLVVGHSVFAVPMWSWLYVIKDVWIWGVFALCHALVCGIALGALCRDRIEGRRVAVPSEGAWAGWTAKQ